MITRPGRWLVAVPRFWRLTLGALATVTILLVVAIFLTRLTRSDYGCLYLDGQEIGLLDIHSGKFVPAATWTPDPAEPDKLAYNFAANRKRLAYLKSASPDGLVIKDYSRPVPTGKLFMIGSLFNEGISDVLWSPDERYVAYHWADGTYPSAQQHLAIADAHGKLIHEAKVNQPSVKFIHLDSWSPDGKYLAVIEDGGLGGTRIMTFWSIPDLQSFDAGDNAYDVGASCGLRNGNRWDCQLWASEGHTAAYAVHKERGNLVLVMMVPGESNQRIFNLPESTVPTVRWSPDGRFIAVGSFGATNIALDREARLDIYGMDGSVYSNIDNVAEANLNVSDSTVYAQMQWSPDGKSLFYARLNPNAKQEYDIVRYQVDDGSTSVFLTVPSIGNTEIRMFISPDNQTAAFYVDYRELYLVSMRGKLIAHVQAQSLSSNTIAWSPDSTALVYPVYDSMAYRETLNIVSNNGADLGQFEDRIFPGSITWTHCDVQ